MPLEMLEAAPDVTPGRQEGDPKIWPEIDFEREPVPKIIELVPNPSTVLMLLECGKPKEKKSLTRLAQIGDSSN